MGVPLRCLSSRSESLSSFTPVIVARTYEVEERSLAARVMMTHNGTLIYHVHPSAVLGDTIQIYDQTRDAPIRQPDKVRSTYLIHAAPYVPRSLVPCDTRRK